MSCSYDNSVNNLSHFNENFAQNSIQINDKIECFESHFEFKFNNNNSNNNNNDESIDKDESLLNSNDRIESINDKKYELNLNLVKRHLDYNTNNSLNNKRFKLDINDINETDDKSKLDSLNSQFKTNNVLKRLNLTKELVVNSNDLNDKNICDLETDMNLKLKKGSKHLNSTKELVENSNELNDKKICDLETDMNLKPKKGSKRVKWRENIVNLSFNEDSLSNQLLSETYYYYGVGLVTGQQGSTFGGHRFIGFSRHLFSDQSGITVELCKPFIINHILIELENKTHKKSPLFAYKVLIAIDECMTDWDLIKDNTDIECFGRQDIHFYPRFVQYIRIIGYHGIYREKNRESEARYFTLFNFDCIFDNSFI